jgi:hypothetical protein
MIWLTGKDKLLQMHVGANGLKDPFDVHWFQLLKQDMHHLIQKHSLVWDTIFCPTIVPNSAGTYLTS